jgi:hypothetical protein
MGILGFVAPLQIFPITEHPAHVLGILLFIAIGYLPLMHLFMHHGHHHGSPKMSSENMRSSR